MSRLDVELAKLHQCVNLNSKQQRYLEATRWLFSETDEVRQQGRTMLIALVLIEEALRNPGKEILLRDHIGNDPQRREMVKYRITGIFRGNPEAFDERVQLTGQTLVIFPRICKHCQTPETEHARDGKCLFDAKSFEFGFIGRYQDGRGRWFVSHKAAEGAYTLSPGVTLQPGDKVTILNNGHVAGTGKGPTQIGPVVGTVIGQLPNGAYTIQLQGSPAIITAK